VSSNGWRKPEENYCLFYCVACGVMSDVRYCCYLFYWALHCSIPFYLLTWYRWWWWPLLTKYILRYCDDDVVVRWCSLMGTVLTCWWPLFRYYFWWLFSVLRDWWRYYYHSDNCMMEIHIIRWPGDVVIVGIVHSVFYSIHCVVFELTWWPVGWQRRLASSIYSIHWW